MIEGRLPADDVATEVALAEGFADQFAIEVGDQLPIALLTTEEITQFTEGFGEPDGPQLDLRVVGRFRMAGNTTSQQVPVLGTPALADEIEGAGSADSLMVRLADGVDPAAFRGEIEERAAQYVPGDVGQALGATQVLMAEEDRERTQDAAGVVARGLLLVGGVGVFVGATALFQALLREQSLRSRDRHTLAALGLVRRERRALLAAPVALVALPVALATSVVGAIALSPLLPIGAARVQEPSPGVEANLVVLMAGALATGVLLIGLALTAARWAVRPERAADRPSAVAAWFGRSGLPITAAMGGRFAVETGARRSAIPVRTALAGVVVGAAAVIAAGTFSSSLGQLLDTPERFGAPGDLEVVDVQPEVVEELVADDDVDAVLAVLSSQVVIDGRSEPATASEVRKGTIGFLPLEGRAPTGPSEVSLGPALADRLEVEVGDTVALGPEEQEVTVVGLSLARVGFPDTYATAVLLDPVALAEVAEIEATNEVFVRYASGVDVDAKADELGRTNEIERFEPPDRVADVGQVRNLPTLLAAAAGLLGLGALGHALVVLVRRRRTDLAVLRALGATPRQTEATVLAMTALIVVTGVLIGVPVGLVAGSVAWRALATSLDVADDIDPPTLALLLIGPLALLAAAVAAVVPTWRAGRVEVAEQLRRE